ncbi:hypothetical protein FXO37_18406 [Capsicum annuum]|nr:hypothetical protein FXO37_18406 [Capsicum annuum]
MARGNKHKAAEGDRSKRRKKRAVDQLKNRNCSEEVVEASVRAEQEKIDPLEATIDEEALILPHCARICQSEEEGEAFFKKTVKKRIVNAKRLLKLIRGGRLDKEDKFKCCLVWLVHCILLARDLSKIVDIDTIKMVDNLGFFEKYPWGKESFFLTLDYLKKRIDFSRQKKTFETKGVSSYAVYEFFWAFMIWIYKAFSALGRGNTLHEKVQSITDEPNDAFMDGLKTCLEGVTVITSSEDGEDGDDDQNLGENVVTKHVTRGAGTSKSRASEKTPMIENFEERVFRLEESIKDIADFVKEERLMRAEKERQKKRDEAEGVQMQSRHSTARAGRDDSGIKEALLEVAALEHAFINTDEVMIPEVAAVVDKENLDKGDEEK